ncbi:hypothetical protein BGZ73_003186 [Actinomortierella ambigua]|nr:hypothetical protein BGZ73_003186 [Actinomortierella ambigua]
MSMLDKFKLAAQEAGKKATEAGRRFQQTATEATRQLQTSAKSANINLPIPDENATEELNKAAKILREFVEKEENVGGFDNIIPAEVFRKAEGLVIYSMVKAGFIVSARGGSGVAVVKNAEGQWSAPVFIATGGMGFGALAGADLSEIVLLLMTKEAVAATLEKEGSVTFGGGLSVSAGPVGVGGEVGMSTAAMMSENPELIYAYTRSKGLFAGVSVDGTALYPRKEFNAAFYGRAISAAEITRTVPAPSEAASLYQVIEMGMGREL